ncbi:MAG: hypothetical protein U9O89_04725 [Thermoproteota archaeon]|nr:hypothetical protein [Thermoproteota archaeon]
MVKQIIRLEELGSKSLAVDANNFLYQYFVDSTAKWGAVAGLSGNVTSHLVGLMFCSTRLLYEHGINIRF